jgi:membrane-associated phospholipid phosphatase
VRARRVRVSLALITVFVVLTLLDKPLAYLFMLDPERGIDRSDLYRFLRVMGYLGTWIAIGALFILHDRNRHRGAAIIMAPLFAGLFSEGIKLSVARERPVSGTTLQEGWYHFREPFSGFINPTNLGFPSSHTAVAFAGCLILACLIPRAKRLLLILAIGCGLTRLLVGAHFSSDVFVGALIGVLFAKIMCHYASMYIDGVGDRFRSPR